jgi:predicted RNA binding protein YcfA (HicA-like mRNA interferase family)
MPPRVREVIRMLEEVGFRRLRSGKGDHTIFARGEERVALDGSPNHELPMPVWAKIRKNYGLKEK